MEHDGNKTEMSSPMRERPAGSSTFYDSAWEQWNDMIMYSPAPRIRREKLICWLSEIAPKSLLDVGCGNGEFLSEIHRSVPTMELTGADISPAVIESNRARYPDMTFYELDLNRERLQRRFDAVVCMEVLEHCRDYQADIERLAAMTEKWLLITVPCGPLFEIDRRVGHIKHFKPEEMKNALANGGLHVIKIQEWGFPFFNLYKHIINLWPDKICDSFLSEKKYDFKQKMLASATYAAFHFCLPKWGYQMFVMAGR
jgi:SAM-dependent methyltransferase